jgi:uncharacterized protein (TIGR02996 family)
MSHAAFLSASQASPDEDTPRLVYADWLDEQGGETNAARAEFIRTQVQLAQLDGTDPRRPSLEDRENELLRTHESSWAGTLPEGVSRWNFRRGFLSEVWIDAKTLAKEGTDLFARFPIASLHLQPARRNRRTSTRNLDTEPWLAQIRHLDLTDTPTKTHADADRLLLSKHLTNLRSLEIASPREDANKIPVLTHADWFSSLEELTLKNWNQDPTRLNHVLGLTSLRTLRLAGCRYTQEGLWALLSGTFAERKGVRIDLEGDPLFAIAESALRSTGVQPVVGGLDISDSRSQEPLELNSLLSAPGARNLDTLDLSENRFPGPAVAEVVTDPFWSQAKSLSLTRCSVPVATARTLAANPAPELRCLKLGETGLRTSGVRALCCAAWANGLTELDIMRNQLDDDALVAMAECGKFTNLRLLDLRVNSPDLEAGCKHAITDVGVEALADSPSLSRLRHINLYRSRITARGVEALLNGPHWRLESLDLGGYDMGPGVAQVLAESPRLARFTRLGMSFTQWLGDDALMPVAESPYLSPLCYIDIRYSSVSPRVRAAFQSRVGRRLRYEPSASIR